MTVAGLASYLAFFLTIALIYLSSYGGRVVEDASYWPAAALLLGAFALRGAAAVKSRRRRA